MADTSRATRLRVGVVGTGSMGEPMVERLLSAGHEVRIFARRAEVVERLTGRGAVLAPSLAELPSFADVVLLCLFSDAQVMEVAAREAGVVSGLRPGAVLVNHTTGSPVVGTELVRLTAARDAHYVDAPVSGTAQMIRDGRLTVLLGGDEDPVSRAEAAVRAYAEPVIRTGGVGSASAIKLINNVLFAAQSQLVREAARAGLAFGVEPERLKAAIGEMSGGSAALRYFQPGPEANAGTEHYLRKDVNAAAAAAAELGLDIGVMLEAAYRGELDLRPPQPAAATDAETVV